MTYLILATLLFPRSVPDAIDRLASPLWPAREAAQRYLIVACRRDQRNLAAVERALLESSDEEVRLRCFIAIRTAVPCSCNGSGWSRWGTFVMDFRGNLIPMNAEPCPTCEGRGSPALHPRRDTLGWPGMRAAR